MDTTIEKYGSRFNRQSLVEKWRMPKTVMDAKGKLPETAWAVGKDILLGAIIGAGIGKVILKKHCLWVGALIAGAAYYSGRPGLASIGIGMMSSGFVQVTTPASRTDGSKGETAKDRLAAFKEELKQKFFLDKIIKKKTDTTTPPAEDAPADGDGSTGRLGNPEDALNEMEAQFIAQAANAKRNGRSPEEGPTYAEPEPMGEVHSESYARNQSAEEEVDEWFQQEASRTLL